MEPIKKVKEDQIEKFRSEMKMFDRLIIQLNKQQKQLQQALRHQQRAGNEPSLEDKFNTSQIQQLCSTLEQIKKYSDLISAQIQHQLCSLSTLKPTILQQFPQLSTRHKQMLDRGTKNIVMIKQMLIPYRLMVEQNQAQQRFIQTLMNIKEHGHGHCNQEMVVNMFHQMVREWSSEADLEYIKRIIGYLDEMWNGEDSQNSQEGQKRVLAVGCGMGRIMHELKFSQKLKVKIQLIQGHQSDVENYLWAQYFLNYCTRQLPIYPYIHNFCNYLKPSSPYRELLVPSFLPTSKQSYPLTMGNFFNTYKTHQNQWHCLVTTFFNYHIRDILKHIRLIYNMLKDGGVWVDVSTANFGKNVIPMCYSQYEEILDKSQFKLVKKWQSNDYWYGDKECLMNEMRISYYRVMVK